MQDMIDLLGSLRDKNAARPAAPETVAADVARAHRAQTRRRLRWTVGTGVVAVAAVAAVTVGVVGTAGGAHTATVASGPAVHHQTTAAAQPQVPSVRLDAYVGTQPAGFTVATVPSGWTVRSSNAYSFVVEPPSSTGGATPSGGVSFVNAIAVMLQGDSTGPTYDVTPVTVDGHAGKLGLTEDRTAEWLVYADGSGHQVLVQVPVTFKLTDGSTVQLTKDQIVQFASGITVTGAAKAANG